MKAVRFSQVVKTAGRPEVHLVLTEPKLDHVLQKAAKSRRVMTLHRSSVGQRTDFGTVGFVEGVQGQTLIFPRSIGMFEGRSIVGIKYDLLAPEPARGPRHGVPSRRQAAKRRIRRGVVGAKVIPFPQEELDDDQDEKAISRMKRGIRSALKALAGAKPGVASRVLEDILKL